MGISDTENGIQTNQFYITAKEPVCFFCHEEISGLFVVWVGTDDLRLHHECACKLGQELIRDGLDTAELISRTKAGFPARLRPTVVPYQTPGLTAHEPEYSRQYRDGDIRMTGSGGRNELAGRLDRLSDVISYAAGRASVKRHVDERVFLSSILAAHDHKGYLAVLWQNQASAISFGGLMVDAWEHVCENGEMVDHYIPDAGSDRLLYSGRDPSNWQAGGFGDSPF